MLTEFQALRTTTNALALAVGVIIGGAVGTVVAFFVGDLLMPVIGLALPGGDWRSWRIGLSAAPDGKVLSALGVGNFIGVVVDFGVIAFCVFLITRALRKEAPPPPGPAMKTCAACGGGGAREGHALQALHERGVTGIATSVDGIDRGVRMLAPWLPRSHRLPVTAVARGHGPPSPRGAAHAVAGRARLSGVAHSAARR